MPFVRNSFALTTRQLIRSWVRIPFTGFVPFFRNKFPGLFQDSDNFSRAKIHINPSQDLNVNSPYYLPSTSYFLVELNRFPEPSKTSGLFPGISSPGKCHNKIPGLSRFFRTRTNPVSSPHFFQRFISQLLKLCV